MGVHYIAAPNEYIYTPRRVSHARMSQDALLLAHTVENEDSRYFLYAARSRTPVHCPQKGVYYYCTADTSNATRPWDYLDIERYR